MPSAGLPPRSGGVEAPRGPRCNPRPPTPFQPPERFASLCPQLLVPRGAWRGFSAGADGEERVSRVLREKFPRASAIRVVDISGKEKASALPNGRACR